MRPPGRELVFLLRGGGHQPARGGGGREGVSAGLGPLCLRPSAAPSGLWGPRARGHRGERPGGLRRHSPTPGAPGGVRALAQPRALSSGSEPPRVRVFLGAGSSRKPPGAGPPRSRAAPTDRPLRSAVRQPPRPRPPAPAARPASAPGRVPAGPPGPSRRRPPSPRGGGPRGARSGVTLTRTPPPPPGGSSWMRPGGGGSRNKPGN